MAADLARHDEILNEAVAAHDGRRFTHTGDGLGAAFPTAAAAISAAIAGQVALAGVAWNGASPLRVRMAIHAGSAEARDGTFLGPTLNRTARLLDGAQGGEIICSQTAADLARDELPPEVMLVRRGERRLRGLSRPESVWQVFDPALPGGAPVPETAPAAALPEASLTSFVGRAREVAELSALLAEARLVTITGLGGLGKTRLALELTARCAPAFTDGAALVELAPVGDDRPLAGVVLAALGLDAGGPSATAADERLDQALAERHLLLVLDNCEHLLASVRTLAHRVVRHCPRVTIVATSREALSVPGEQAWVAPGLSLPPETVTDPADLAGSDAAALFIARARVAQPGFGVTSVNMAAVASICRRLDGLPLALELAAARVRVLGAAQVAAHLDDRFRLLTGGHDTTTKRHQTLAACMDWSYEALPSRGAAAVAAARRVPPALRSRRRRRRRRRGARRPRRARFARPSRRQVTGGPRWRRRNSPLPASWRRSANTPNAGSSKPAKRCPRPCSTAATSSGSSRLGTAAAKPSRPPAGYSGNRWIGRTFTVPW